MIKRFICDIDQVANEGRAIPMPVALKRIANYIQMHYDSTFPEKKFTKWADSSTEQPLRHNRVLYYWTETDVPARYKK